MEQSIAVSLRVVDIMTVCVTVNGNEVGLVGHGSKTLLVTSNADSIHRYPIATGCIMEFVQVSLCTVVKVVGKEVGGAEGCVGRWRGRGKM